ncbi:unnamed protein product [Durusdinium trenchii]|uniref:Uncharacterized protein n=2 Tax=Durusdinium trenchii TaxID=1381693 RepID=A0ABP0KUH2_9DINO
MWVWRFACLVAGAGAARPSGGSYRGVASAAFEDKPGAIAPASPELVFEMRSIARFWLFLGFVGLTGYGSSVLLKNNRLEQDFDVSRSLKLVAVKLHKEKVFMQTVCGAILFGLADVLGQFVPSYHEKSNLQDGYKIGGWDWRYTVAVVTSACVFQVAILGRFYDYCDQRLGPATTWQTATVKMIKMQGAFILAYLPLAVFFFALLMCFIFVSFADSTENCGASALAGAPRNLGSSVLMAAQLWPGDYLHSMAFWPPSHLINYVLIQRWSPNFRPIFDGVVVLSWNAYVLAGGAKREAVGPTLFGAAPGATDKIGPSLDCSKYSAAALRQRIFGALGELAAKSKEGLIQFWYFICRTSGSSWKWLKHGCNWLRQHVLALVVFVFSSLCWLVAFVLYSIAFALLWILTGLRITLYWLLAIIKGAVMIFFSILDFIKKCMVVWWFLPDVETLCAGCYYCVLWPKEGQWPKQICGPAPAFNAWVSPFCPHCY